MYLVLDRWVFGDCLVVVWWMFGIGLVVSGCFVIVRYWFSDWVLVWCWLGRRLGDFIRLVIL